MLKQLSDNLWKILAGTYALLVIVLYALDDNVRYGTFFFFLVASAIFIPATIASYFSSEDYKRRKHEQDLRDAEREAELNKIRNPKPDADPDARF